MLRSQLYGHDLRTNTKEVQAGTKNELRLDEVAEAKGSPAKV